jgi:hypothetical protein
MIIWLILLFDAFVALYMGGFADAAAGKVLYSLLSFVLLALPSFIFVGILSYLIPRRSSPFIHTIEHYHITNITETTVTYRKRRREYTIDRSLCATEPLWPETPPFIEIVRYKEGGQAGFWLFDIYKYKKEYILYIQET